MRIKSPIRFFIAVVTFLIVLWMFYNFLIALQTGQKYSFFGNGTNDEINTFVVAGVDEGGYRTDLILLCQVNRRNNEAHILQIPRDTRVENKRNDRKINSAYYSGFKVLADEIEQVTGLRPEHYVTVSLKGFRDIVNAVGGVTVDVPFPMKYSDPAQDLEIDLKAGKQRLNGKKAEMYMRYRKGNDGNGYADGDVGRMEAQKTLYTAVAKKLLSPWGILRMPFVFSAVKRHTETDFTTSEIAGIMKDMMIIGKNGVKLHTLPGGGKYMYGVSYFVANKSEVKTLMQENFVMK